MISKKQNTTKLAAKSDQRGVTLLLSILILAAVTAIVFSIAGIAINETSTSGDLIKSEPAITAAEAGTEDVLYYSIRGVGTYSTNCSAPTATIINGVSLKYCANPYLANPYQFTVPQAVALVKGEKDFFLYNPITPGGAPGFTALSTTLLQGPSGTLNICTWNSTTCLTAPDVGTFNLTTGQTVNAVLNPNIPQGYQVIFLNPNTTSTDVFNVTTSPTGMPAGSSTLEVTASNGGVTRKIQTILPQ